MPRAFHAELVTPERVLFSDDVEEVSLRSDEGEITFLAGHEDYLAVVDITVARLVVASSAVPVQDAGGAGPGSPGQAASPGQAGSSSAGRGAAAEGERAELRAAVHGGFVQVDRSGVRILAAVAELAREIDVERARRAQRSVEPGASTALSDGGAGRPEDELPKEPGALQSEDRRSSSPSPAALALLEPEAPATRERRAVARLEAAGATLA